MFAVDTQLHFKIPGREWLIAHKFWAFFAMTLIFQQICITYARYGLFGHGHVIRLETLAPMMIAGFLIWLEYGTDAVWQSLKKLTRWRLNWIWYFHALFWLPIAALAGVVAKHWWFSEPLNELPTYWAAIWHPGLGFFVSSLFLAVSEEIAWFGFAFATLHQRYSALTAALITGFAWAATYIPLWEAGIWVAPGQPLWTVVFSYVAWAVIMAWIYNSTGSAFILAVMQLSSGYSYSVLVVLPHLTGEVYTTSFVTVALGLMALGVVLLYGPETMTSPARRLFGRKPPSPSG